MSDKPSVDTADVTRDEKVVFETPTAGLEEDGGRRKSVALNLVENPLKVSLALCPPPGAAKGSHHGRRCKANHNKNKNNPLTLLAGHSALHRNRLS